MINYYSNFIILSHSKLCYLRVQEAMKKISKFPTGDALTFNFDSSFERTRKNRRNIHL